MDTRQIKEAIGILTEQKSIPAAGLRYDDDKGHRQKYRKEVNAYRLALSILDKLERGEIVEAKSKRVLPEGFTCLMSSDDKTLYVWHPDDKHVAASKMQYFSPSGEPAGREQG